MLPSILRKRDRLPQTLGDWVQALTGIRPTRFRCTLKRRIRRAASYSEFLVALRRESRIVREHPALLEEALVDLWNATPRSELGGLSPQQLLERRTRAGLLAEPGRTDPLETGYEWTRRDRAAALFPRGFTLTELLVVLAILALLGAMAIPALRGAMDRADQTVCLSNLRQLGQGVAEYVVDYGHYPAAEETVRDASNQVVERRRWYHLIAPYLDTGPRAWSSGQGRAEIDPTTGLAQAPVPASEDDEDQEVFPEVFRCPKCKHWLVGRNMGYGYNHQTFGDARPGPSLDEHRHYPVRPSQIVDRTRTILIADSQGTGTGPYRAPALADSTALGNHGYTIDPPRLPERFGTRIGSDSEVPGLGSPTLRSVVAPRHRGGVNVLFADYSVRWVPLEKLERDDGWWNGTGEPTPGN